MLFSNNQVYCGQKPEGRCTVELNARRLVVMGNYVEDGEGGPQSNSICLPTEPEGATAIGTTAIGNVTRNGVAGEGTVTPNVIIVNNAVF